MTDIRCRLRSVAVTVGALAVLLPSAGCSSQFTYVPVKGKVVMKKDKKPVTVGSIVFMPDKENALRKIPSAKIGPDGTFELTTEGKSGAPIGSYVVCVRGPMRKVNGKEPPPLPFSMKYFDANESPLKIEVVASPAPGAYDFELD